MIVTTLQYVHARSDSGRTYSASEGTVSVIDDNDPDMVALMRELKRLGVVTIDEPAEDTEDADDATKAAIVDADDDTKTAIVKPAKRTRGSTDRT